MFKPRTFEEIKLMAEIESMKEDYQMIIKSPMFFNGGIVPFLPIEIVLDSHVLQN